MSEKAATWCAARASKRFGVTRRHRGVRSDRCNSSCAERVRCRSAYRVREMIYVVEGTCLNFVKFLDGDDVAKNSDFLERKMVEHGQFLKF